MNVVEAVVYIMCKHLGTPAYDAYDEREPQVHIYLGYMYVDNGRWYKENV